ncbi:UDP-N-acetylmuramoyl-tripeptide--D-alanyl-D-alanine ligase [Nocardioides lentus]|uniref:UDP-N-acetylmuramoyl-tripeptide--D-alanyl-D-alanine ligase n=1 Tax=Nocardioides lentus TaxID=338077 RepID=A0ABP5AH86_9ACTN
MIALGLRELAGVVGGRLADATGDEVVTGAATLDSREVPAGGLFVAMAGEHVDGHDYAVGAHAAGAAAVLAERATGAPSVLVDDVTAALGLLARHVRDRLPDATVLALTGSQGKTGTKDYLAAVLDHAARAAGRTGPDVTVATRGNLNNELGVPLTVLRATEDTRHLVVEMGARGVGHIRLLCDVARPDAAAVLNVGSAHLGEFGSVEAIAQAKGEIVEQLAPTGTAVLAADDPRVAPMASRTRARVLSFGGPGADVAGEVLTTDDRGRATFALTHAGATHEVALALPGRHQVANATAAVALALAAGADLAEAAAGLRAARPDSRWRMEVAERADGVTVVNDAYNANPASVRAALDTLADMTASGRRGVAVLGEMKELGDGAAQAHHEVGAHAGRRGVAVVVAVDAEAGGPAAGLADGAERAGARVVRTAGRDEATAWVRQNVLPGDVVLVKASRGVALEHLAQALLDTPAPTTKEGDLG